VSDDMSPFPWPNAARCAVMLTFDFDAETLWLSRDPENARRPGVLSQGVYGAKTGVLKILEVLRDEELRATFFTPGWTAEKYRDRMEAMVAGGHEIGHHGYLHEWIDPDYPDKEREALEKGLESLERAVGIRPVGYRSPGGETSNNMIALLREYGFLYDSSLMDQITPYRHLLPDGTRGPIELPWHWSLDDAPYALFSMKSPRPIMTNDHILNIWKQEFSEIYRWGGLFNVIMHPQVTGRPSRIAMLRDLIAYIRRFPNVWFATGQEVAEAWAAREMP
jgi:peptidoglycan/xylan/chitin deacetylase (PgdA/CDA1 family)